MNGPKSSRFSSYALGATLMSLVACGEAKAKREDARKPPPPTVYTTEAKRRDLPIFVESVGALDGYVNAEIRARVKGYLQKQLYKDGARVKEGQLLFTLEPAEYAAALAVARAGTERARVALEKNRVELDRNEGLFRTGMLSRQDLDNSRATVADSEAQLKGAQAQVTQAQLNLSYTRIQSPITGVAGLALVRVGNWVGQDAPTLLTTVSQIDVARVNFPLSEVEYVRNPARFEHLEQRDLKWAEDQVSKLEKNQPTENGDSGIELILADGSHYSHRGVIVAVNRQVDANTGTLQVQGLVPNPESLLRPGQYARVRMQQAEEGKHVIAVPEKALIAVQGTYSVAVVGDDRRVHLHRVELGPSSEGERVVKSGLKEGEMVVIEGVQKINDGAPVNPVVAPPERAAGPQAPANH